jgi:hypothetical protein
MATNSDTLPRLLTVDEVSNLCTTAGRPCTATSRPVTFADIRLQRATSARARFEDERARELIEELRPEAELVTAGWPKRCATWLPRTRRGTAFQRRSPSCSPPPERLGPL